VGTATSESVVIIGAGQAGITLATTLRERGWAGTIHLVGDEHRLPYQRPPLSKGYLSGTDGESDLHLSSTAALRRANIDYRPGLVVERLDTSARVAFLERGMAIEYSTAVFATGAAARPLPLPGRELQGVHTLRTVSDSDALRRSLADSHDIVIIGGGFIGLEIASVAPPDTSVTVLEGHERILLRSVSEPIAKRLTRIHQARGVRIVTGANILALEGEKRVARVRLGDTALSADLVLIAVGAEPNTYVARRSGLDVDGGIVVDENLRTQEPTVFAIGDCARFPNQYVGTTTRLESVQNATDQARYVAGVILGEEEGPYRALPWFWSHQGGVNLQVAGLSVHSDTAEVVADDGTALTVHRLRNNTVVAVETIDNPRAHVQARRSLAVDTEQLAPSS
jgi:3-phenylpropionate/trans-cinnamate dioxygenase ferredoxin reductase subunit